MQLVLCCSLLLLPLTLVSSRNAKASSARTSPGAFSASTVVHSEGQDQRDLKAYFKNQSRLVNFLFEDYNRNIPAIYTRDRYGSEPRPQQANVSLYYMKLLTIDEPKQTAQMIIDLIYNYVDPRLSWSPDDFDGIQELLLVKKETLWIPDIFPYDVMTFEEAIPEERQILTLFSNGTISYYSTAVFEFICHLHLKEFPFDEQECDFRLTSFNAPTTELKVLGSIAPELNNADSVSNGEWLFRGVTVENSCYSGQLERQYSMVVFHMQFQRSTTYYFMLIIIPSSILTVLCLSGLFWTAIERDSYMENLNLGLTAILAMMLVMEISTENMPRTDDVNKLSRYTMVNLALITVASLSNMFFGKMQVYNQRKELKKLLESQSPQPRLLQLKYAALKWLHIIFLIGFNLFAVVNLLVLIS